MKKLYTLLIAAMVLISIFTANGQAPALTYKGTLSKSLLSATKAINATSVADTINRLFLNKSGDYTIEVKAKVNSVSGGRGMDIDVRDINSKGFRVSFDAAIANWTNPLATPVSIGTTSTTDQTFRFTVEGSRVHVFQNNVYLVTKSIADIKDVDQATNTEIDNVLGSTNLIDLWDGNGATGVGSEASSFGWSCTNIGTNGWGIANGANVRFADGVAGMTYNGSAWTGTGTRVLYTRWDGIVPLAGIYSYPVTLEANKTYQFSMLYGWFANASAPTLTVGVGTAKDATGLIASKNLVCSTTAKLLQKGVISVTPSISGTYYITFKSSTGCLCGIGDLTMTTSSAGPRIIIGKNYTTGTADMNISSVTYEDGAYSPIQNTTPLRQQYTFANVTDSTVTDDSGNGYKATLKGKSSIKQLGTYKVLDLGANNGYLSGDTTISKEIRSLWDFTVSTYVRLDNAITTYNLAGNFLWSYATNDASGATVGKYIAYRINAQRYALSTGGYNNEKAIQLGSTQAKDVWKHVVYTQSGSTARIYIDGVLASTATIENKPYEIMDSTKFRLGRPPFAADNYLKNALIYDYRLYNKALAADEITTLSGQLANLNKLSSIKILVDTCTKVKGRAVVGISAGQYLQSTVDAFTGAVAKAQAVLDNVNQTSPVQAFAELDSAKTAFINSFIGSTTDATLSDLTSNSTTVIGFAPGKTVYNIELPAGTTTVPTVAGITTQTGAGLVVTAATSLPGSTTVNVTALDATTKKTYTVTYTVAKSTIATLSNLTVSGTAVSGFATGTLTYNVELPLGTTTVPAVIGTATDSKAAVIVTPATALPGATKVDVTAEDGTTKQTYTINFTVAKSTVASLSDLKVGNTMVTAFATGTMTYNVKLSTGTTIVPNVTGTATDSKASVVVTPAAALPGATTVVVTAEDGTTKLTYTINFTVSGVGITTLNGIALNVYPTISNGSFTVETSGKPVTITVLDINGKVVSKQLATSATETVTIANAGMYFIKLEYNGTTNLVKVVKTN